MKATSLARKYNEFQSDLGRFVEGNIEETISSLFSEQFKKIINGETLVQHRNALQDQIKVCREQAGKWTIDVKDVAAFEDPQRCLIRYHLISEKLGAFDIMAILKIDSNCRIEEVNEVYYLIS